MRNQNKIFDWKDINLILKILTTIQTKHITVICKKILRKMYSVKGGRTLIGQFLRGTFVQIIALYKSKI